MLPVKKKQQKMFQLKNFILSYSRSYFHSEERVSKHLFLASGGELKVGDIASERLMDVSGHIFQIDKENDVGRKNQRKEVPDFFLILNTFAIPPYSRTYL